MLLPLLPRWRKPARLGSRAHHTGCLTEAAALVTRYFVHCHVLSNHRGIIKQAGGCHSNANQTEVAREAVDWEMLWFNPHLSG